MATINKEQAEKEKTEAPAPSTMGNREVVDSAKSKAAYLLELEEDDVYEDMQDYEIPMIKLMQGLSDLVKDGEAQLGEYRDSVDGKLLASRGEALELILLTQKKYWHLFCVDGEDKEWRGQEPYNAETANYPFEEEVNGETIRRVKVVDWYVLLANEDDEKIAQAFPFVFRFQVSLIRAAKNLNTKLMQLRSQGVPRSTKVFNFTCKKNPNDTHGNLIPVIEVGRDTTEMEQLRAAHWITDLRSKEIKVVEGED